MLKSSRRSFQQIQAILQDYRQSGLTQRDFVRQHGISLSTLSNWLRKSASSASPIRLKPVQILPPALDCTPERSAYEVHLPNGCRLVLPLNFDGSRVNSLIEVLAGMRL